jgi:hypothetical protein
MHYSSHGHQTLPTTTMKTLSVQLAPQHLILKTTKPNLNQHSKEKKKTIKNFSKTKTSKLKRTKNSTKSLESQYSTRCQEYQIPTPTKKKTLPLQDHIHSTNQTSLPKTKRNKNQIQIQPKTQKKLQNPEWKQQAGNMNLSKCNKPQKKKTPTNGVVIF